MYRSIVASVCLAAYLVAGTVAARPLTLTLTLDPSRSTISMLDVFFNVGADTIRTSELGNSVTEQEPGSSETTLSGTLEIDLDLTAETLAMVGGSVIDPAVTGSNLFPDDSGNQGNADMAIVINPVFSSGIDFTLTRLLFEVQQAATPLLDMGGFFGVAGGQSFTATDGEFNLFFDVFSQFDATSMSASNLVTGGTLTVSGKQVELILPFELDIQVGDPITGTDVFAPDGGGFVVEGQIVATGIVPEPSGGILFALGVFLLAPFVLRLRKCK